MEKENDEPGCRGGVGVRFFINLKGQLMKKVILLRVGLLICATSLFACGCVVSPNSGVVVTDDPPAPLVETVPADPGTGFVWVGGEWGWHDHWVWEKGRWQQPPHPGAVWVPHQYANRDGKHVFVRGGWR